MIAILMATYNGERYIEKQIDSLLKQTVQDFVLYAHDDCSTDRTYSILQSYARRYPDKIVAICNEQNTGSARCNFMRMMVKYKQDYIMLCDQDDVWIPDKIALTLERMTRMEQEYGTECPILVHTDLTITDEFLTPSLKSFQYALNANYKRTQLNGALIQNIVTGCTAMYNLALSKKIKALPEYYIMHDWWLMLLASAFGHMDYINKQTVLYRQHEQNAVGAKNMRALKYQFQVMLDGDNIRQSLRRTYQQANAFLDLYRDQLSVDHIELLQKYSIIPSMCKWERWRTICQLRVVKTGFARKIAHYLFI